MPLLDTPFAELARLAAGLSDVRQRGEAPDDAMVHAAEEGKPSEEDDPDEQAARSRQGRNGLP